MECRGDYNAGLRQNANPSVDSPTSQATHLESTKTQSGHKEEEKETKKRKSFQMSSCMPRQVARPMVTKISQLQRSPSEVASTVAPPAAVARKLGAAKLVIGIDIETADWAERKNKPSRGQFGFYNLCHPEDFDQRIVQIGWATSGLTENAPTQTKEHLVRPDGFAISAKATKKHGITNELALSEGMPLINVMEDFMHEMARVHELGGRIVVHHLEFDAGIIAKELENAGLDHWRSLWSTIAKEGFCTMDPIIASWVYAHNGRDSCPEDCKAVMSLKDAANLLLPQTDAIQHLKTKLHTAGADAQLHRLLYIALRKLCDEAGKT